MAALTALTSLRFIVALATITSVLGGADSGPPPEFSVDQAAWGQGIATELVDGLTVWTRSQPAIVSLSGAVHVDNPASRRVLEKCGFAVTSVDGEMELLTRAT